MVENPEGKKGGDKGEGEVWEADRSLILGPEAVSKAVFGALKDNAPNVPSYARLYY